MNLLSKVESNLRDGVSVKKVVDCPQNFILMWAEKTRPTYDELRITQWVEGFVRCIFKM